MFYEFTNVEQANIYKSLPAIFAFNLVPLSHENSDAYQVKHDYDYSLKFFFSLDLSK